ncbi:DNA ligase [Paenibacillus doosanensis]|uniref:DNA ligase (ATP) n=1 Tax=Paenibacillus konkukensis TaxID=2020716 RepID=A0ABY4RU15_9BACL|nr:MULTISPECIES: RNA ligase family protein [Paenibacillus]MCS7463247.1 DNA ligase [Paenibacillus doosanensis]UQZ85219.1 Putative DNA ligase-like protein [Paenibacillus konkukensis]
MHLEPIVPFEPVSTDKLPEGSEWIAQLKWDGVRMLTYYDGAAARLVNRKLNDRTMQYPELADPRVYCKADSVILDGEIIALEEGKPSFHQVMKRDGLRSVQRVEAVRKLIPIVYMVFDILYADGEWLTDKPLSERQIVLEQVVQPVPYVQLVPSYKELAGLFEVAKQHRLEGIVCKDSTSTYAVHGKDRRWMKKKWYQDLIAVVGGVTHRDGTVNALLLGLYDDQGRLWYIGHAGTGKLTQDDWKALTAKTRSLRRADKPFVDMPERSKDAVWIEPVMTVKVQFMNWTHNRTLRQPSIQAFVDVLPASCRF